MEPHPNLPRPHVGPILAEQLEFFGLSVANAAEAMQTTANSLHQLLRGKRGLTADMALRFEAAFGLPADTYLRLQKSHELWKARQSLDLSEVKVVHIDLRKPHSRGSQHVR